MGTIPYCRQIAAWFQKKSGGYFYFEGGVRYERNRLQRSTLRENESRAGQLSGLATASGAVRNPQSYLRMAFYL